MIAKYLWETGSVIIATMGLLHLRATFFSHKLFPRNEKLIEEMKTSSLVLTKRSTMWKAWIGFNATHSSGAIFIGVVNFYMAAAYFDILQADYFLSSFTVFTIGFYSWVARKYWFKPVLAGIVIAWVSFFVSYVSMILNQN